MSIEGDPRINEAEIAADDAACEADNETAVRAAEFDLERFRNQAIAVHELLTQDTHWVDIHGQAHRLTEMSVRYKANCLAFMRARIAYFAVRFPWGAIYAMELPSGFSVVNAAGAPERPITVREFALDDGGNLSRAFDEYLESVQSAIQANAERWLDETPLMRALSEQVLAGEGGAVGDRPQDEPREVYGLDKCPRCNFAAAHQDAHRRSGPLVRLCTGEWVRVSVSARV